MSRIESLDTPKYELNVSVAPNDTEEGIGIPDIQYSLKKRRTMLLVLSMIAFMIGCLAAFVYMARSPHTGTTTAIISYSYKGVDEGVDPFGRRLDVKKIKSSYVVEQAAQELDLYAREITVDDVRNAISIEAIRPDDIIEKILTIQEIATKDPSVLEQLSGIEYFPTQYMITLQREKNLKVLSDIELTDLLAAILDAYNEYFIEEYADRYVFETIAQTFDQADYDYSEVVKILSGQINNMITYCNVKRAASPDFRSPTTQMTFGDIITNLELVRSVDLGRISALVYASDMSRDLDRLITVYEYSIVQLTTEYNVALESATSAHEMAMNYQKDTALIMGTLGESATLNQSSVVYDNFMQQALSYSEKAVQLQEEIIFEQNRLAALKGEAILIDPENPELGYEKQVIKKATQKDIDYVENAIPDVIATLHQWADIVNLTLEDYLILDAFKDATKVAIPPIYQSVFMERFKIAAVIIAAVTLIGFVAGFVAVVWGVAFPSKQES